MLDIIIITKVLRLKLVRIMDILKENVPSLTVMVDKILLKTIKVTISDYLIYIPITYLGGLFGAVTTWVNTRLGPPLLITRPNPARGRAATAPKYFRTRF